MIVLIKNLPFNIQEKELHTLASNAMKVGFFYPFWESGISKVGIFTFQEQNNSFLTYYGVVFIRSQRAALRVIKKLNGVRYKHRILEAREFIVRSQNNDRRLLQKKLPREILEQRKGERRRDPAKNVSHERRMANDASVFDRENVYLPRRRGDE